MRILITGGAGFIGSHLCEELLRRENEVICVDNFLTGDIQNIKNFLGNPNFKLVKHNVIYPCNYDIEVEQIYNLACPASPYHYQHLPIETIKTNIYGVINMLELAKRLNAKIFQASTSEVYGNPTEHPQTERYCGNVNPVGMRACYDESKRCAETLFFEYYRQYNLNIKIARIFNTYGPRFNINDGRVIPNFITQALQGKDITIYGDGKQTRSFCYISDLINGIIKLINTKDDFVGPINLGNPCEISMLTLANKILDITGSKSKVKFKDTPIDDPVRRRPDISYAIRELEWQPIVSLEKGLVCTISYFEELLTRK